MTFKLLSDFDGVWTDQALEAEHVKLFLVAEAARLTGISGDVARGEFLEFEEVVRRDPLRHGWAPDGRLTAFVDEDPFCIANALAFYLEQDSDDDRTQRYRQGILSGGFADMNAFADACFHCAMLDFRQQHPPALVPHAGRVVDALHDRGVEIVVVSNSPADKIAAWFGQAGVDAGVGRGHAIEVRGQAGKQTLGSTGEVLDIGGRQVHVDRPLYRDIVRAENPTAVIGDVFSLDLALPHVMREAGIPQAPELLILRRHPHTPLWTLGLAEGGPIDHVVTDIEELVAVIAE